MTAEQRVNEKWPDACDGWNYLVSPATCTIKSSNFVLYHVLSLPMKTAAEAWTDAASRLAPEPQLLRTHKWTGRQLGGNPANAESYEWVRFCGRVRHGRSTCEDPMPPCPGPAPEPQEKA